MFCKLCPCQLQEDTIVLGNLDAKPTSLSIALSSIPSLLGEGVGLYLTLSLRPLRATESHFGRLGSWMASFCALGGSLPRNLFLIAIFTPAVPELDGEACQSLRHLILRASRKHSADRAGAGRASRRHTHCGSQAPRPQRWKAPAGWCWAPQLSELTPCCITLLLCSSVCNLGWGTWARSP